MTGRATTSEAVSAAARYAARTPKSREWFERGRRSLEGGTTRTTVFFSPYPSYIERGEGCRIWDVDGNERIDFLNNYTSLIHGHAHPAIVEAATAQLRKGSAFAAPTEQEVRLAEILCQRVPSVKVVRFASSGTEATMFAVRLARAFAKRDKIAKFEGGFHGAHDYAEISVKPPLALAGAPENPCAVPDSGGIPQGAVDSVAILPFNDIENTARIIEENKDDLAGVIVEPIMGAAGIIPARREFLLFLREITRKYGIVLIFDEIITLRVAPGGMQEMYGVLPDLTTMGKIISGGFPAAAFGGRAEIMALLNPTRGDPVIPHSGTFNGNPVAMAAGVVAMEMLTPGAYARLAALGDRLRKGLTQLFQRLGVRAQVTGVASLFNLHFTDQEIRDYRSTLSGNKELMNQVFLSLLNEGIFIAPRGMGCISTPMTEAEVDTFIETMEKVLAKNVVSR